MSCATSLSKLKKSCASPTSLSRPQLSKSIGEIDVETAGDGDGRSI